MITYAVFESIILPKTNPKIKNQIKLLSAEGR